MSQITVNGSLITFILAIGAAVSPIVYGYVIFKMSQHFVTKAEFSEHKTASSDERKEMKVALTAIQYNISELLQRTAKDR